MIRIGMSTTCVYPLEPEHAFRLAKLAGFDGIEIMVTQEESTQQAEHLLELSRRYALPILSVHAPVLLLTHFVWGRDPRVKLERTTELAAAVGAESVVVHPPFRWQATYALDFLRIVREISAEHRVVIAVENMFPWRAAGKNLKAYAPGWDPRIMDCDAVTLDFSHAALSGVDSLEFVNDLGARLRHVHLCDGSGAIGEGQIFDEHLLPGHGREPVAEVLETLEARGWSGSIVAEVNTRKAKSERERLELLRETLEFARTHTHQSKRRRALTRSRRALEALLPGSRH
ncbi:sugar phosphate isomerase/epimerase family protein [Agromyces albus]|uniref:sugar phosphate isomerase/epimerase family protein n=1 Tax=Agromyces albus TaxID=205332 RepID=UPI002782C311|nr:sugar phosphate isomerase/epimerase [Agromyces albus]MDQ0575816.1 sugar phosphate isomerase/epimerase [Agromyces albus]